MKELEKPHHLGHRARLRERLLTRGGESLQDYELLEMLLFAGNPRGDTKPLAKVLIARFGSLSAVLAATPEELRQVSGMGEAAAAAIKVVREAALRMAREEVRARTVLSSWSSVLDYCRMSLAEEKIECFHLLFLNRKNELIADERQQTGTVDHTPVYPREVVRRALELGASALILVHNHPSGDPTPSKADIQMTRELREIASKLGVEVHDHLIIAKRGHTSLRSQGLI